MRKLFISIAICMMSSLTASAQNVVKGDYGYLYCHMSDKGEWTAYALSRDGYNYQDINEGNPIMDPEVHARIEGGQRDAYITRAYNGKGYVMVNTDMCVRKSHKWDNYGIDLLKSKDLINWQSVTFDFRKDAVRAFCKPFNEVGIKTHMLDRGLNALRMYPVPDDVRALMYKVKHAQGVDIPRIFCGLNDTRNIIPSIKWAKEAGMIPQATLCITTSPVHTVEYYGKIADEVIAAGAEEICLKDMAGIGQPAMLGKLTKRIKESHPDIIIEYHGHSGPGLSMASILEVCNNGVLLGKS